MSATREHTMREGIGEAWDLWFSQHPISVSNSIEMAVAQAVQAWMEAHTEELLERIAIKAARTVDSQLTPG
jgi:hypothetical protein